MNNWRGTLKVRLDTKLHCMVIPSGPESHGAGAFYPLLIEMTRLKACSSSAQ